MRNVNVDELFALAVGKGAKAVGRGKPLPYATSLKSVKENEQDAKLVFSLLDS